MKLVSERTETQMSRAGHVRARLGNVVCTFFGVILFVTAFAKLFGATYEPERALSQLDWVFQIKMRWVLILAGLVEAVIGAILLSTVKISVKYVSGFALFIWLEMYRVVHRLLDGPDPNGCGCLGYITDSIGIPHAVADKYLIGLIVLGLGSFLFHMLGYALTDRSVTS